MKVKEYLKKDGSSPYADWLNSLDGSLKFRVQARILRLKEDGYFGFNKKLSEDLYELKFKYLGGGLRIYYGIDGSEVGVNLWQEDQKIGRRVFRMIYLKAKRPGNSFFLLCLRKGMIGEKL